MSQSLGDVQLNLLLNSKGFSEGIKSAIKMLDVLARSGKELGVFDNINLSKSISEIDALALASDRLGKEISDTAKSQATLKTGTDKATTSVDQHEQAQKKLESTSVSLADKIQNVGLRFQGFKAILSVLKSTVMDLIKTAADTETLGVVVQRMGKTAGYTSSEIDKLVDSVQKKGITVAESRNAVIQMIQAELDLSRASDLARLAQNAAVNAQINSSEALGRLIHGMTTFNPLVLRNLGIMVNYDQVFDQHAKTLGKNSKELTNSEKTQASLNAVMQAGEKIVGTYEDAMDTAGKRAGSYARYLEALKVSLGDLLLPAFGKVVDIATKFTKLVTDAPAPVQRLILSVTALAAAWLYLNSSMSVSAKWAGTFFAVAQVLPAPIRIVIGVVMALSAAMLILAGNVTIATGGMNILLGMIFAGVALVGEGILSLKSYNEEMEELSGNIKEVSSQLEDANKNLNDLKSVYDTLASNTVMTKEEQESYNEKLKNLVELYPSIVTGIDSVTGAYQTNADALRLVIQSEEEHIKIKHEKYLYDLADAVVKNTKESSNLDSQYRSLEKDAERFSKQIEILTGHIADNTAILEGHTDEQIRNSMELTRLVSDNEIFEKQLQFTKEALSSTRREMAMIHPEIQKTTAHWKQFIAEALKTGSIADLFPYLVRQLGSTEAATRMLADGFRNLGAAGVASLLGITGTAEQMKVFFAMMARAFKEFDAGFPQAGFTFMSLATTTAKGFKPVTAPGDTPGGSPKKTGSSKQAKDDKEVLNALQEQLKTLKEIDNELQLNAGFQGTVNDLLDRRLQLLRDMYHTVTGIKIAEKMMLNDYIKVLSDIPSELSGITTVDELLKGVDIAEMPTKAADKIGEHATNKALEIAKLHGELDREITKRRIELIKDEFERRRAEIEETYNLELQRIHGLTDASEEQRRTLFDLAKQKRGRELEILDNERFIAQFERAESIANNIQGIFNFGAHTVYAHFLKALQITQQIIALFQTLETLGALKWLGSLLGSIFGFAIGGPAGAAAGAAAGGGIAGMPAPGVGAGSTLERNPVSAARFISNQSQMIRLDVDVHGKVTGNDLRLIQRRVDRIESRREK